jgi:hypothetical protein
VSKTPKVTVELKGLDKHLDIKKVAAIHLDEATNEFIYFEKMKSGDWRLVYTNTTIEDITKLESLIIKREGV